MQTELENAVVSDIIVTKFAHASWKNMFESNMQIADEIKYVFDRQNKPNIMGNTLDRPTFLMKPTFIQATQTTQERLKGGTEFTKHNLAGQEFQANESLRKQGKK